MFREALSPCNAKRGVEAGFMMDAHRAAINVSMAMYLLKNRKGIIYLGKRLISSNSFVPLRNEHPRRTSIKYDFDLVQISGHFLTRALKA